MRPLPHAMLLLVAVAVGAPGAEPQPTSASSSPTDATAVTPTESGTAANRATPPPRPRPMSPTMAALLAEKMPKFTPPPKPKTSGVSASPILVEKETAPEPTDLREVDRPRNTIIRLPSYVVREEKPEDFKDRHILTGYGRLQLGLKRYPGLRFGSLPILSNDGWALAMLEEDYRLERKAEMEELVTVLTSPSDHAKAKTEVQKAFMRED